MTIDTSMTAGQFQLLPRHGRQRGMAGGERRTGGTDRRRKRGNVDATFACLAAMDGAETVSAYARFNCTARYDAASDEYIVVVLYG